MASYRNSACDSLQSSKIQEGRTKVGTVFSKSFSMVRRPNRVLTPLKKNRKDTPNLLFSLPKSSFGEHKVVTKDSSIPEHQHIAWHVATIFCNHLAKLLQKIIACQKTNTSPDIATIFCNHLAKFMLPKRRFWKDWPKMKSGFSKHFSRAWVLNLGH